MQINRKVRAYAKLARLPYIVLLDLLCVLFIVTFEKGLYEPALIGLGVMTVTFVSAGSTAINDYCDRDSDDLTHPERPIPANQISPRSAARFSILVFIIGLGASLMINYVAFGIVALNVVLFILYASVIKRFSGFVSNLIMGYLGTTIVLFSGAVVFQAINAVSLSFFGLIAGAAIGINVLKDILTLPGDLKARYPTLAAKRGIRVATFVGVFFLLISAITSPLPFFFGAVGVAFLVPITVWSGIVLVLSVNLLKTSNTEAVMEQLKLFTTYWPYFAGIAGAAYILPFIVWRV
jgi:geranylgeranylglycerol-phosphate geranylgeranyltransferase